MSFATYRKEEATVKARLNQKPLSMAMATESVLHRL